MEQTREAIDHAKAAEVPIIVAINKIDKPEANPEQVKRELSELGLVPEEWGGETLFANVSAMTGEGIDGLLDLILLQAEILELKSVASGRAEGRVIEARLDRGRGPMATVLIRNGQLTSGDPFVCGVYRGKIRALLDDRGEILDQAGPSMPVEIQGISGVPNAGDEFVVLEDEKQTKQVSQYRQLKQRETELLKTSKITLENLFDRIKEGERKELNVVINADVQGSLEAINDMLARLATDVIKVNVIRSSLGAISETDIMLAAASEAMIIGFIIRPNSAVQELADSENVEIRYYDVIYKLTEEVKGAMVGLLDPTYVERPIGQAEVIEAFHVSKVGTVAGSAVTSGKITRGSRVRLLRDGVVIFDGQLASLKRFKDDIREVTTGYECGIALENFNDIKIGDLIEAYVIEEKAGTL
jgi:translation initiation factor IF-2